jgi:transcription initiation factor TFIIB
MEMKLTEKCPECGSENLIKDYESGERVCGDCGFVLTSHSMDSGKEWRAFTLEEEALKARGGQPTDYSVFDKGLSTEIGSFRSKGYDALGRPLSPKAKRQIDRLRRWHFTTRVHKSIDRNLFTAMTELERLSDKLSIPKETKRGAAIIYRKALKKNLIRGRSIKGIVVAALYIACRITGVIRTLKEISGVSPLTKIEVGRYYRLLLRELDIKIPVVDPVKQISIISERIGIPGKIQGRAVEIIQEAKKKHISDGKDPISVATAALYIASEERIEEKFPKGKKIPNKEKITQRIIAEAAGVTEVTIRNRCKELKKNLHLLNTT